MTRPESKKWWNLERYPFLLYTVMIHIYHVNCFFIIFNPLNSSRFQWQPHGHWRNSRTLFWMMMLLKEYRPSTSRCYIDWKFNWCLSMLSIWFTLLDWLQLIYDDQIERLKEKEQKDAKKRQRLGENFSDLLYSITVLQLTISMLHYLLTCKLSALIYSVW